MKNLQWSANYQAADLELPALPSDGLQTAFVQPLDQGLNPDRNGIAIRGHHPCGPASRVDVQKKVLTIQPYDPRALGQPFGTPMVACALPAEEQVGDDAGRAAVKTFMRRLLAITAVSRVHLRA
jgi:hypothetical protein